MFDGIYWCYVSAMDVSFDFHKNSMYGASNFQLFMFYMEKHHT